VKSSGARVTVNAQLEWLPLASVAVHVTVVVPTGKPDPDSGEQVTVGEGSQLSVAVAAKLTGTSKLTLHPMAMLAGQVMAGGSVSLTVTVKEQVAIFPEGSVAVQLTVVVPFGKAEPDAREQVTVTWPELSVAVAV